MTKTNSQPAWTREGAEEFLNGFKSALREYGYTPKIVGGVEKNNFSNHDLDVLLQPHTTNCNDEAFLEHLLINHGGWDHVEIGENPYEADSGIIQLRLEDNRIVDWILSPDLLTTRADDLAKN